MLNFRLNLRIVATTIACLAVIFVTSCSKDSGGPATSTVKTLDVKAGTGGVSVDVVKLMVWDGALHKDVAIAEGAYSNGGFKIDLPDDVDSKYLGTFDYDEWYDGITVSNKNAKGIYADIAAFNGDKIVGYFNYEGETKTSEAYALLMYADSDVSFTGSGTEKDVDETYHWSVSIYLKKGWNWAYEIDEESSEKYTTSKPSGLKWVFERY